MAISNIGYSKWGQCANKESNDILKTIISKIT